jgi:glycosyltransferase involved in cell wall biosynthesis
MRIAIVHDELVRKGGAEQVTLLLHKAFPDAPVYTSVFNLKYTYPEFANCDIRTSWLQYFVRNEKWLKRLFFPWAILAMRNIYLKDYDVVLMSTTTSAKFVRTDKKVKIICFCHYPFRLAWFPESYSQYKNAGFVKKILFNTVINILKNLDYKASKKIDWFITNTNLIKQKLETCYHPLNEVSVIPASIPCKNFEVNVLSEKKYYLVVSRLEPYKKVDMVVSVFNELPGNYQLIIVGKGSQKNQLLSIAKHNIEFKENISSEEIKYLYTNCKALIFPQEEDYGLTPLEANASGRPVIAYARGGILDTQIPYSDNAKNATACFFYEQTELALKNAIIEFEKLNFDSSFIKKHAENFDEDKFINKIREFAIDKMSIEK